MASETRTFDYIVVGAGSAGAIVAARLSENPKANVLLLEAGPEDDSYWSKIPLGFAKILFNPRYMWGHPSEPEQELKGRQVGLPHGKVLGGSSAINGLVYVRGFPFDYQSWVERGAVGWGYEDVLPFFRKLERNEHGANKFRGGTGPLGIEDARWQNPFADAVIDAIREQGVPRVKDFAAANSEGAGYWQLTSWNGRRSSTSEAYLKPNRRRPNLHIETGAFVTRVDLEGKAASGVTYEKNGRIHTVRAGREVILSAGALQTPHLLQVSGIGPGALLRQHGITVVHDLPGVGENLMDHIQVGRVYTTNSPYTFNRQVNSIPGMVKAGLQYYLGGRRGPLTLGASLAGGYVKLLPDSQAPDIHFHFLPFRPGDKGWDLAKGSGFRFGFYPNRPDSRGHVRIKSADIRDPAAVTFNHLTAERDVQLVMEGMKFATRVAQSSPLKRFDVREVAPGPRGDTDEALLEFIRETADTAFHYSGTATIGTDPMAVVDPELRVHGIGRLRVIDASVMPTVVSGNTNAAVLMIGEKGADLVKKG